MFRSGLKTKLVAGFGTLLAMLILLGVSSYYAIYRVTLATRPLILRFSKSSSPP